MSLRRPQRAFVCALAGWLAAASLGCSHLSAQYVMPGYGVRDPQVIKHVTLCTWAPATAPGLAPVAAQVAADFIKLRKNYLLHDIVPATSESLAGGPAACGEGIDGVLVLRILDQHTEPPDDTHLHGALTLVRCSDGAHVFRSEGKVATAVGDKSLADLRESYGRQLGEAGKYWAAPAFGLVQALAEPLPDPHLDEADIEAKIELGAQFSAEKIVPGRA